MLKDTAIHALTVSLTVSLLAGPLLGDDVLLIPDSGNDRVWAFDPFDGSVVDDAFIPSDGNLVQPINAVASGHGTILISDENADSIFEYGLDGQLIRVVAGPKQGLDALQGLAVHRDDIYVGSRTAEAILKVSMDGSSVEVFAAIVPFTPRDIVFRGNQSLVSNSDSDAENIERFRPNGSFLSTWHDSDGIEGIDFPQQLKLLPNGGILAAGFSPPNGLYVYGPSGEQIEAYTDIITSPRGVHLLGNGMILYAGGTRVMRFDPATGTEETIVNESGTSFRYIEAVNVPSICTADLDGDGFVFVSDLLILIDAFGPCPEEGDCPADLDGNGVVDARDLVILVRSFGNCDGSGPPLNPNRGGPMSSP